MRRTKENRKGALLVVLFLYIIAISISSVSAGVGVKWSQESKVVDEGERACLTYNVYNPWPEESFVEIKLSEELEEVLVFQESEKKFVPAHTSSDEAIPIEFCFDVPFVYEEGRDCLIGNFVCGQECEGEQKIYDGEVLVSETAAPTEGGGTGGSAVSASVSAPLKIKVMCNPHLRDYTIVYILAAVILIIILLIWIIIKRRRSKKGRKSQIKVKKKK